MWSAGLRVALSYMCVLKAGCVFHATYFAEISRLNASNEGRIARRTMSILNFHNKVIFFIHAGRRLPTPLCEQAAQLFTHLHWFRFSFCFSKWKKINKKQKYLRVKELEKIRPLRIRSARENPFYTRYRHINEGHMVCQRWTSPRPNSQNAHSQSSTFYIAILA